MKRRVRLLLAASLTVALLALAAVTVLHVRNSSTSRLRFQSKPGLSAKANYALLPDSEVASYAKLFSSDSRADISGWEPTARDIVGLEGNLYQIATLREAPDSSRQIVAPNTYFRQYLAVVQGGKKWIFVNAFCEIGRAGSNDWRKHLEVPIDGGKCFWRAWYDPEAQRFSNLLINGLG